MTHFIVHINVGMGTLEAMGWLDGSPSPAMIFWLSVAFIVASVLYAWARSFVAKRGPLEALMRAHTPAKQGSAR